MHDHEDVPYQVENIRKRVLESWSRMDNQPDPSAEEEKAEDIVRGYMHGDRLTGLRNTAIRYPLLPEDNFVNLGDQRAEQDAEFRKIYKNGQLKRASKSGLKTAGALSSSDHGKAGNATKKAADTSVLEEMRKDLMDTLSRLDSGLSGDDASGDMTAANTGPSPELLRSSLLAGARVGPSGSSKLNYLLNEVFWLRFVTFTRC